MTRRERRQIIFICVERETHTNILHLPIIWGKICFICSSNHFTFLLFFSFFCASWNVNFIFYYFTCLVSLSFIADHKLLKWPSYACRHSLFSPSLTRSFLSMKCLLWWKMCLIISSLRVKWVLVVAVNKENNASGWTSRGERGFRRGVSLTHSLIKPFAPSNLLRSRENSTTLTPFPSLSHPLSAALFRLLFYPHHF